MEVRTKHHKLSENQKTLQKKNSETKQKENKRKFLKMKETKAERLWKRRKKSVWFVGKEIYKCWGLSKNKKNGKKKGDFKIKRSLKINKGGRLLKNIRNKFERSPKNAKIWMFSKYL